MVLTILKSLLSKDVVIFILIILAVIGVFVFSNSETILTGLGYETTASVKAQLARTQSELEQAKAINDSLIATINDQETRHKNEMVAVVQSQKDKDGINAKAVDMLKKKQLADKDIIQQLKDKIKLSDTEITLPIDEYNKLSLNNINTLKETYNSFFPN